MLRSIALFTTLSLSGVAAAAGITLTAADGTRITAQADGKGTHGVVVVPGAEADSAAVASLHARLAQRDLAVVTPKLRAAPDDVGPQAADVDAAVAWLHTQGVQTVSVVGLQDGGNLALHAAAANPKIASVAWISPRLSAAGLSLSADLTAYGARPLLMITTEADATGSRAAAAIDKKLPGTQDLVVSRATRVGAGLLADDPKAEGRVVAWAHTGGVPATVQDATGARATESIEAIETTGTKFGR